MAGHPASKLLKELTGLGAGTGSTAGRAASTAEHDRAAIAMMPAGGPRIAMARCWARDTGTAPPGSAGDPRATRRAPG